MPAHPTPHHIPTPVDDFLLDEEFDIFDTVPYNPKPKRARLVLISNNEEWDELDSDDIDSL